MWRKLMEKKEVEMRPHSKFGDLFTMEEWLECVADGGFIDYDGYGNYATLNETSNIEVKPSDVKKGTIDKTWTHIMWYNKQENVNYEKNYIFINNIVIYL